MTGLVTHRLTKRPASRLDDIVSVQASAFINPERREAERPVVPIRQGKERTMPPPSLPAQSPARTNQNRRGPGMRQDESTKARRPKVPHDAPRQPTSAAPRIGPSLPSPEGRRRRSFEYHIVAIDRAASLATSKNSSP